MTSARPSNGLPGYEHGAGTHYSPNVTWWKDGAGPWISYSLFWLEVDVPAAGRVRAAPPSLTVDDGFELKLNGALVCRGDDWQRVYQADLADRLRPGRNQLEIKATNQAGPADLIVAGDIRFA